MRFTRASRSIDGVDGAGARRQRRRRPRGLVHDAVLHAGRHPRCGEVPQRRRLRRASASQIVLGNTYHLMLRPGADVVARFGGLGRFTGWDGLTLTDSGGYPGVLARPEGRRRRRHVPQHLRRLDPPPHPGGRGRVQERSAPTSRWCSTSARRCRARRGRRAGGRAHRAVGGAGPGRATTRPDQALFGIVQGGIERTARAGAPSRPRRSTSTATASAGCRSGRRAPRCCRRWPPPSSCCRPTGRAT